MQQIPKIPQRMNADHLLVIEGFERRTKTVDQVDVEVITPEFDHDFVQLPLAEHLPILGRGYHLQRDTENIVRETVNQLQRGLQRQREQRLDICFQAAIADIDVIELLLEIIRVSSKTWGLG